MNVSSIPEHVVAAALCWLVAGAAMADWTDSPFGIRPAGEAELAPLCGSGEEPCIKLWGQMSPKERAKVWLYLDEVAKDIRWREMTIRERKELSQNLCDGDREALRHRFTLNNDEIRSRMAEFRNKEAAESHKGRKSMFRMRSEERRRLREQIFEAHMEYSKAHPRPDGPKH